MQLVINPACLHIGAVQLTVMDFFPLFLRHGSSILPEKPCHLLRKTVLQKAVGSLQKRPDRAVILMEHHQHGMIIPGKPVIDKLWLRATPLIDSLKKITAQEQVAIPKHPRQDGILQPAGILHLIHAPETEPILPEAAAFLLLQYLISAVNQIAEIHIVVFQQPAIVLADNLAAVCLKHHDNIMIGPALLPGGIINALLLFLLEAQQHPFIIRLPVVRKNIVLPPVFLDEIDQGLQGIFLVCLAIVQSPDNLQAVRLVSHRKIPCHISLPLGSPAQDFIAEAMKGPNRHAPAPDSCHAGYPLLHLVAGLVGESQADDFLRPGTLPFQNIHDAAGQGIGLAGACRGQEQDIPVQLIYYLPLFFIQKIKIHCHTALFPCFRKLQYGVTLHITPYPHILATATFIYTLPPAS